MEADQGSVTKSPDDKRVKHSRTSFLSFLHFFIHLARPPIFVALGDSALITSTDSVTMRRSGNDLFLRPESRRRHITACLLLKEELDMVKPVKAVDDRTDSRQSLSLPDYGFLYFDHLKAEFESVPAARMDPEVRAISDEILRKREDRSLRWPELYTFDLILSRLLSPERLPRKAWSLRSRYRDVAGLKEYEAYLASKPPDLADITKEQVLRADIEYLLGELYLRYTIGPVGEGIRDRISKRVTTVILIGVGMILVVALINAVGVVQTHSVALAIALFVGAMGGLLSLQQRYQSALRDGDPIDNTAQLMQNWPRIFLPAINGAIFAVVLYLLIAAGLVSGDIFPKIGVSPKDSSGTEGTVLLEFLKLAKPVSSTDFAKLLVWSFVAGFAERFVPDTLTRFASRREAANKSES
jgi:hypothetical protein